jgi:hypothetical protein
MSDMTVFLRENKRGGSFRENAKNRNGENLRAFFNDCEIASYHA